MHSLVEVDDEFTRFFRALGYTVTWDYDARGRWYEIVDEHGLLCQIDCEAPLADFLEDLPALATGQSGTSAAAYEVRCPDSRAAHFRALSGKAMAVLCPERTKGSETETVSDDDT